MKNTIIKIGIILLIFCIAGQGCEKDENIDSKILGKWQHIYSTGGVVGISYPDEEYTTTIEFTDEGILIEKENNVIMFETEFSISDDYFPKLTYSTGIPLEYRGIPLEYTGDISSITIDYSYTVDFSDDKLVLISAPFSTYYKRIKH